MGEPVAAAKLELTEEAPTTLERAACALAAGEANMTDTVARVDRFVTSRVGFRRLLEGRYRGDPPGERWDDARLANELAKATGEREAAETVASRVVDVGRMLTLSEGSARRDVVERLERTAPVSVGASPYRPVRVSVTRCPQRQVALQVMGGVEVRCIDVNPGASDTLLLIHGHASRIEEYETLVSAIGDAARVVMFDLPGCGYSDKPGVDASIASYEPVIKSFLDAIGVSRCVVAGGGLGGNLTLRLALRYPALVRRAVAWSVAGWGETNRFLSFSARALARAPQCLFWTVVKRQLGEQFSADFGDRERLIEADLAYRREVYESAYHGAYFHIAADQVGTSMLEHASEIEPPVTLLAGAEDEGPLKVPRAVQHLAGVMGVEAHLLDAGYALNHEQPEELAEHIRRALAAE